MRAPALWAVGLLVATAGCLPSSNVGFVEIKVPSKTPLPALYLDSERLEPLKDGGTLVRQRVGSARLQMETLGGRLAHLCDVVVRKNRITAVTLLDRPLRCQCRNPAGSDSAANRVCAS